MKNIICIIARTNSTRLPQKTIREINEKKLIEHIIDSMKEVTLADEIYLCTSNEKEDKILLEIAAKNGIKAYAGSPNSVIDRILNVAELENADNVLRVTGDNIFTDPIMLNFALQEHIKTSSDYSRVERLPIGVTGEVMKVSSVKDCYNKIEPEKSEYLALYMFNPDWYKCLTILPPKKFILPYKTLTVDTCEDWIRTKFIFEHINENKIYFGDIEQLNEVCEIPFFHMPESGLIKLPENNTITYKIFRDMNEKKIEKSMKIFMSEGYYEAERNRRHYKNE